jgi:uncharacterized protein YceK
MNTIAAFTALTLALAAFSGCTAVVRHDEGYRERAVYYDSYPYRPYVDRYHYYPYNYRARVIIHKH